MTMNKTLEYYMHLPYPILLTPPEEEGDGWYAEIPLLDGCGTSGETKEIVLVEIEEAKRLWIETMLEANQAIPEPERIR
jgi:antitoxin HicB